MMYHILTWFRTVALILPVVFLACSDPVRETQTTTTNMTVYVKDTNGVPQEGVAVYTIPATITVFTDSTGMAVFNDIKPGHYQVWVIGEDISPLQRIVYVADSPISIQFYAPYMVTLNLTVTNSLNMALDGATIKFDQFGPSVVTDENGHGEVRVSAKKYTVTVIYNNVQAYIPDQVVSMRNGPEQHIDLAVPPQPPVISIDLPDNNPKALIGRDDVLAIGSDFEDGPLPSEAFSWFSDINGYVTSGQSLMTGVLTPGNHLITLVGKDSSMRESECTTSITFRFAPEDTYFPLDHDGSWSYVNTPDVFSLVNDQGTTDTYQLFNVLSETFNDNKRTTTMTYCVNDLEWITYTVTDYYAYTVNGITVTNTVETLQSWVSSIPNVDDPDMLFEITINYSSPLTLIQNQLDITEQPESSTFITAEEYWEMHSSGVDISFPSEHIMIEWQTIFEGFETVTTDAGTFETAKIRVIQDDSERYWWLAIGYGIVQYSYNNFDTPITASLIETNLDYIRGNARPAFDFTDQTIDTAYTAPKTATSSSDIPYNIRELVGHLRSMAPR